MRSHAAGTGRERIVTAGDLLVELQCEELPARFVRPALAGLVDGVTALLSGIEHGPIRAYATPRRLAVAVDAVASERASVERTVTGPPADRAFDADGKPTAAAVGFARGKGVDPSALMVVDGPKGKVIAVVLAEGGERTSERLAQGLPAVILGIPFAKSMEWGLGGKKWGRPLHRVSAVLHGEVIPGEVLGISFGNSTVGHRLAEETQFSFSTASEWLDGLRARAVEPDLDVRKQQIRDLLSKAAHAHGGDDDVDEELLEEVANLVEAPTLVVGEFDRVLLELPPRLLVQTMKHHQRYFPIRVQGKLTHRFVAISNNPWADEGHVAAGNARVLKARFDDARFFFADDNETPLAKHGDQLARMRWIRGLGTMASRQDRVAALARELAPTVGADPAIAERAGALSKCDLVTKMVGEFPELQGHMGRLYAAAQGEPEAVAVAIEEQYSPRGAGDAVATTPAGAALALAERLDTLVGCFAIGIVPTSSGDPQGLRRAVAGVLATLIQHRIRIDLGHLFATALRVTHESIRRRPEGFDEWIKRRGVGGAPNGGDEVVAQLVEFALGRFKASEVAEGLTADLVDAVLAASEPDPLVLHQKAVALGKLAGNPQFSSIMETFKRVLNITRGHHFPPPEPSALSHPAELALAEAASATERAVATAVERLRFGDALDAMLGVQAPVAALFDAVMVDSPDPDEKAARIGLLLRVARTFLQVADFSRISTR
jgi:glycyl-tRNA synthetase beta chain